jgi:hypothetical protein
VGTGEAGARGAGSAGRAAPSPAATAGADGPSCVVAVRVSRGELRAFEAAIRGAGLTRSTAMKRLMRAASGFFDARDEAEAETLRSLGAALARAGSNANQIARACNAAQARGERLPWAVGWPGEVAELGAAAFGIAREVRALADGRRARRRPRAGLSRRPTEAHHCSPPPSHLAARLAGAPVPRLALAGERAIGRLPPRARRLFRSRAAAAPPAGPGATPAG